MPSAKKKAVSPPKSKKGFKPETELDKTLLNQVIEFFNKDLKKFICNKFSYKGQSIQYGLMTINVNYAKMLMASNKENNRNISKANLTKIKQAMNEGDFLPLNGQNIVLARKSNGKIELIDGQHRMQALIDCNKSYPFQITVIDNANENIFISMDSGKSRNTADHLSITNRNSKVGTSLRIGYGYANDMPITKTVDVNDIALKKIYDKNEEIVPLYNKLKKCIIPRKAGKDVVADKLFFDQAIYFALYMIDDNFGSDGKKFVKALTTFDKQSMDSLKLSRSQKSTVKHIQWLFNGVNRGFEDLCIKHRIDYFSSDTRPKRLRKSLFLLEAFLEYFMEDVTLNKSKTAEIIKDTTKLNAWPDLGEFPI